MATPVVFKAPAPNWIKWQQRLDHIVDGHWSEQVVFYPITGGDYTADGTLDPNRKVLDTIGVFMRHPPSIVGLAAAYGGGGGARQVEQEVWVSLQADNIGAVSYWQAHDLVYFPARNETYEILYPGLSDTRRPIFHLARINPDTGPPSPLVVL